MMKQASENPKRKLVVRATGRLGAIPEMEVRLAGTWALLLVTDQSKETQRNYLPGV